MKLNNTVNHFRGGGQPSKVNRIIEKVSTSERGCFL